MRLLSVFLFSVFLGSFSFSSLAIAFEDDGTWQSGSYYQIHNCWNSGYCEVSPTKTELCSIQNLGFNGSQCTSWNGSTYSISTLQCGSGSNPVDAHCDESPEVSNNCPSAGDVVRLARVENGYINDQGVFINENVTSDGVIEIGGSVSADGCGFARSTDPAFDRDITTRVYSDNQLITWENYVSTGELLEPAEDQPQTIIKENLSLDENSGFTDTRENTKTEVNLDPVVETLPDGTVQQTDTSVITENRGDGVVVKTQTDLTTVVDSDGITKQQTTTTTTTTNPDGSKTVVEENHYSFTQHPQTIFNISDDGDRISITNVSGGEVVGTTKTTTQYDSSGAVTSQTTEENNSAQSNAEQESEQEQQCLDNPDSEECSESDLDFVDTEKGSFKSPEEEGSAKWHYDRAVEELNTLFADIQSDIDDELGVDLSGGSSSLQGESLSWRGEEYSSGGGIFNLINWFDFMNISTLVLLAAALFSFFILTDR